MQNGGFLDTPSRGSKTGLAIVIAGHAAAIVALALTKPDLIHPPVYIDTGIRDIADPVPPEVAPPLPLPTKPIPHATTPPIVEVPIPTIDPVILTNGGTATDTGPVVLPPVTPPTAEPVFVEARMDPAAAGRFQPDYPAAMARAGIEGFATVRILIGTDGRVHQVVQVNATDPAFFAATERQALRSWRFRAATRGGEPIESWRTLTVRFRMVE